MTQSDAGAVEPVRKLLGSTRMRIGVALASALVLAAGAYFAPPAISTTVPVSQERATPLLEEQMQARSAPRAFGGVQELAPRVRQHGVAVLASASPSAATTQNDFADWRRPSPAAGFGVFVSDVYVLTHAAALDGQTTLSVSTADHQTAAAEVAAYDPSTGLVLLRAATPGSSHATFATEAPAAGALIVGVAAGGANGDAVVPVFVSRTDGHEYALASGSSLTAGTPLYTLDGELLAIAGGSDGSAVGVGDGLNSLMARAAAGEQLASTGIAFQELTPLLARAAGERGVLISAVVEGGPAQTAGIEAGDLLAGVGDVEIDSVDTAARVLGALKPGTPVAFKVLRSGRRLSVDVRPRVAYEVAALARASDAPASGPEARVVLPAAALAAAGIPPAARLLSVNGREVSSRAQALKEIQASRRPVLVQLQHGGHRFFAALEAGR